MSHFNRRQWRLRLSLTLEWRGEWLEGGIHLRTEVDLDAPIVPGKSAGGFHLGQPIENLPALDGQQWQREPILDYHGLPTGQTIRRSDAVDLWVTKEHVISQIGVHGPYRGKLFDQIELGMTIDDVERIAGPCAEDINDNLSIYGVRGLAFDVEWHPHHSIPVLDFQLPELRFSPLTWFFVYEETEENPWGFMTIAWIGR